MSGEKSPEFAARISYAVDKIGTQRRAASLLKVTPNTLTRWVTGETEPSVTLTARIADLAQVDVAWLICGRGAPDSSGEGFVVVPRFDVHLAAGHGAFLERARKLDDIPFTRAFLQKKLGRSSTDGLALMECRGDSMWPTISDGDLVMADLRQTELIDDIYAFAVGEELRVKRLRRLIDGVEIISDNAELYRPEVLRDPAAGVGEQAAEFASRDAAHVRSAAADRLQIIGRIIWIGRVL